MRSVPSRVATGPPPDELEAGNPVLEVEGLVVEYQTAGDPVRAVDEVSLVVNAGETVAIVGESGSGKSTVGLAVMGLLPPGRGRVAGGRLVFQGTEITGFSEQQMRALRGRSISMVFQDPLTSLNPVMRVGRQIREMFTTHLGMSRADAKAATVELLERVQLPDAARRYRQFPQQFSGGMRQRVVIAMAVALRPALVIADEPTTALDVTVQSRIMSLLGGLTASERMGLLLITHDLAVVAEKAQRIYIMYGGRVVESGRIRDVYERPLNPYTRGLLASVPTADQAGTHLKPIGGSPPDLGSLPAGCAFHPRCPLAQDRCRAERPALREVVRGRHSACHFAEELARS